MGEPKKSRKKFGLQNKILILCVTIVLVAIGVFAAIGMVELRLLFRAINESSEVEDKIIKKESEDIVWDMISYDVLDTIDSAARNTEGEFWTLRHDYEILAAQVVDIMKHPEQYQEKDLRPPYKTNEGKFSSQILFAEWADQNNEENISLARKLANLEPVMREIIEGNYWFTSNCYIALPCGITIAVDDMSADKVNPDGSAKFYDATKQEWYQEAVATGKPYCTSLIKSYFHDLKGMGMGVPVYIDGELVAVLHGFTPIDILQDAASAITYYAAEFTVLISDDGQVIYSPRQTGELAVDEELIRDVRDYANPSLKSLIDKALELDTNYAQVVVDGEFYYGCYAPIYTLEWTQIMFISKADLDEMPKELLDKIDDARGKVYKTYRERFTSTYYVTFAVMAALIVGALIAAFFFSKRLVTPLNRMTNRVKKMTGDDMDFEMEEVYRTGDEIEILAGAFNGLTDKLKDYIVDITVMSAEKERIDTEMAMAKKIQDAMLPRKFPAFPDHQEFDLFADMTPAKEVGGDFYDFYFIDDDHLALVIGDVSGKGITAALFMAMTKHIIQSQIMLYNGDVAKAVESANSLVMAENAAKMFVTIWLGVLTVSTGQLIYANAGHEYPIICRKGGKFELYKDNHGVPLACTRRIVVKLNEIELKQGDILYLYTDGMTEAINEDKEMFGHERIIEVLDKNLDAQVKEMDEAVRKAVYDFAGNAEQFDDMTSLVIKLV